MTPNEHRVIRALARATFVPGTGPKRFVWQMAGATPDVYILTERQRAYLWAIAWSWRRQLPADLVEIARHESGGRGINSRKNPPDLPPPAPRAKQSRRPGQERPAAALRHPVAAFGQQWLREHGY